MNWTKNCYIFLLFLLFITIADGQQFDIIATEGAYTDSLNPTINHGDDEYLKTWNAANRQQGTYLKFFVPNHTDSAVVHLYLQNFAGSYFRIYQVSSDWKELEITSSNGKPILEGTDIIDQVSNKGAGVWYSFNVSSVVDEPGNYSFYITTQYGYKNEFNSTRAAANQPYMTLTTCAGNVDIVHNTKTNNDSCAFIVEEGEEVSFSVTADDLNSISSYSWYVNKENQGVNSYEFSFIVPAGIENQPSSKIWEIRVEGIYENNSKLVREWLISSLSEEEAPDFIDFFIDRDNRWRTGYISDPWGRPFPCYNRPENLIPNGYYTGSDTSTGKMLSTKFDITDGTFKFKIRNPGALNINYFKVWDTNGNSWRMEWTANEFHDYFSILNEHGYIPVSRRWLGQAPGVHWWKGDEWRDITIIKTPDGWFSVYENGVLLPYAHANFEDAVTDATKLTLASNSILQMDSIEVYNNKYIHPETTIEYGTYPKWWRVGEITYGRLDPTDENGIIVSGKNVTLKQISDAIDDAEYITYDPSTHTTVLKTNLSLYDGSELTIDNEILIIDTSSQSLSINPKVGVTLRITDSTLTATDNPLIWNIASSVSQNVFDPDNTRNIVASSGTDRHNPVYDFRGNFIIENSTIDNTGNLFLDAPYEVTIRNVVFSNHSSIDYGDYTLRGAYENHNQKKRQSYGEKGLWIVPRMDLTAFVIENITFIQPKTDVSLKFIGGEWIQSATTICDSDLRGVDIIAMKALKYEYYVTYWDKNEKSTLALLNTLYDEGKLAIGGHVRLGGAYDYNEASILTKYYLDISVEDSEDNSISGSDISLISSSTSYPAENLYEYRDYISDAEGPGQGGVTNYGSTHAHNETYTGGVHTRWYNALPLSTAVTDSNGHTALPESDDPKNSIVLIDYVLTSDAGNLKKESLTYTLNANAPSGQSVFLSGISPDSTWYREDPHIPSYTITAIIPDNSTSGPSIIGFAPSEDNPFVPGSSKKFRVWTDEMLTTMEWYVDGVQVSSGSLEYDWSILEGSHTIHFEGACTNGAVMQSWSVTGKLQVPEEPKVPESSGSGTSYTPSATSFTSSIGESTNFIVDTDEQFTSTQWYFNGAAVASGTTSYTQNWDASGSFTVSFEGATDLGTATRTWNVVVSGSEYSAISVVPSASVVAPGETFSLDMYIDPKQPVTGAQLNMHYSTLASVTSVRDGGLFKVDGLTSTFQSGIIDNSAGVVRDVYSAVTGSGAVSTAGSMATVDMVAGASSGMLELTLSNVVLSDAYSNPAPYDITYASILVDTAPEFNAIPAISVEEESALTFAVSATDEDGDTLTYTSASMPQGATFDTSTGAFSWTPARGQAGTYSVEFEVTDGYLNDTANAAITVTSLNRAPVITLFEPASGSEFEEGQVIDISVVAEDPEGESLSYSLTINGVQVSSSASYQWVTDYSCAGTHTIGVTVSDGNSQASQTHTVTILDVHPRWDVNQDGVVNILDITHVGQNYGNTYSEDLPRWDVNQDCIVNVQDLSIVAAHFGETL